MVLRKTPSPLSTPSKSACLSPNRRCVHASRQPAASAGLSGGARSTQHFSPYPAAPHRRSPCSVPPHPVKRSGHSPDRHEASGRGAVAAAGRKDISYQQRKPALSLAREVSRPRPCANTPGQVTKPCRALGRRGQYFLSQVGCGGGAGTRPALVRLRPTPRGR